MASRNNLIFVTGANGAVVPDWFSVPTVADSHAQINFIFSLIAGTATYFLEGKNSPDDAAIQLDTGSASKKLTVERFPLMRCRLSASAGAQVVGSLSLPLVDTGS